MKKLTFLLFALLYMGMVNAAFIKYGHVNKRQTYWKTIKQINEVPIANAGIDTVAFEGDTVHLNGSLSYDPDSESLTYQWMAPDGITLSDITIAHPSFTAPNVTKDTTYILSLVVNDGTMESNADKVSVTVRQVNKAPIANAGIDVEGFEGDTIYLDGSQSYDPEGKPLYYTWTTLDKITLSANQNSIIKFTIPRYLNDTVLVISLVVDDGKKYSQEDRFSITVWHINRAPVANAGRNQEVDEGKTATLDGSSSYDPEKKPVLYKWIAPDGITLSSSTDPRPVFTAPEVSRDTAFYFKLVVNDGLAGSEPEQVKITVRQVNKAPIAKAGDNFSADEGTSATLDGSFSSDADGDLLKYLWTTPEEISLSSATDPKPTFMLPEVTKDTTYIFFLVVNDGKVDSSPVHVSITVRQVNKVPVANAIIYLVAEEGDTVTLDGSLSSDDDGDPLIYKWMVPNGIVLNSTDSAQPTFIAPEVYIDTSYAFILVVNDGIADSSPQTVWVSIKNIIKPTFYKVYPNPTTGIITVEYSRTPEKQAEAIISNIAGNVIMRIDITERTKFQIDLSGNSSGLYILTILDNNKRYNHQILLKRE